MHCTDIVDKFYNHIASDYKKYIGRTLKEVIIDLSKTHIIKPYKLKCLRNNDIIIWESRRDKMAHITAYKDNKFYCSSKSGIKVHPVLIFYKNMLVPKYIIRLKTKEA